MNEIEQVAQTCMGWPEAFSEVGVAFAVALGLVGFVWAVCR